MYETFYGRKQGPYQYPSPTLLRFWSLAEASVNQDRHDGTRIKEVYHDWVSSFRRTFDGVHLHATTPR